MIHNDNKILFIDKYYYLRTYVKGEALDVVKDFPLTDASYLSAWKALKAFYENKRRLTNMYLQKLLSVKPMKGESHATLNKVTKEINGPYEALKALDSATMEQVVVYLTV